jgi:hypothetical protein
MKKFNFQTSLEAIDWIADYANDEGHFEVLREELNYNYIYTGQYFLEVDEQEAEGEVALLKGEDRN